MEFRKAPAEDCAGRLFTLLVVDLFLSSFADDADQLLLLLLPAVVVGEDDVFFGGTEKGFIVCRAVNGP